MTPLQKLDLLAPGSAEVLGAEDNGNGAVRLTFASTKGWGTGDIKSIHLVRGTTEANGTWPITVVDFTHIDLPGSTFEHPYEGGGVIAGSLDALDSVITSLDHV